MAVVITQLQNFTPTREVEIIDGIEFEEFGTGGFSAKDLLILGDDEDDIIESGIGHDKIEGGGGNDINASGDGNDELSGGDGDDYLDGKGGTNKLFGDAGNDLLRVGSGHDRMNGGSDSDTFGFYGAGYFEVQDFTIGEDRLFFDSEKLGVDNLEQLLSLIIRVEQNDDSVRIEFFNDAASITLVGVDLEDISPDMVIFTL
jgi:Ca2+-binding RTX toxin-like protein